MTHRLPAAILGLAALSLLAACGPSEQERQRQAAANQSTDHFLGKDKPRKPVKPTNSVW